ncbi:MAG: restriction endonuclease subunit S [bacterium]
MLPVTNSGKPDYAFIEQYMKKKEQKKIDAYKKFIANRIKDLEKVKEVEPLSEKEWGEFFIEDVAEILSGKDIYEAERFKGNTPYISATAQNNGIGHFVGNKNQTLEEDCLSVNRNGSVGYSFYHPYKALFSNDCRKLRLKNPNKYVGIFISQQITKQRGKYGYGYKMGTARLKRQKIVLPINKNSNPDYEYMKNYVKRIEFEKLRKYLEIK